MANQAGPVLAIGATGQQGGATARALLQRGWTVHALVRNPDTPAAQSLRQAGASLVTGDLDDPASLRAAMRAVHGVFLVLTMMTGPRVTLAGVAAEEHRGKAVADIAKETGIGHLVYSSISGADLHTGIPHVEAKAGSRNTSGRLSCRRRSCDRCSSWTISRPTPVRSWSTVGW